ncbi:MAG: hypothetical protein ACHQ5A_03150, partial [Opitutales bacterium]
AILNSGYTALSLATLTGVLVSSGLIAWTWREYRRPLLPLVPPEQPAPLPFTRPLSPVTVIVLQPGDQLTVTSAGSRTLQLFCHPLANPVLATTESMFPRTGTGGT